MMKAERLAEIKERADNATGGPWKWGCETPYSSEELISENGDNVLFGGSSQNYGYVVVAKEDAEFIADARQDVPELVAEVERLRKALEFYADEDSYEFMSREYDIHDDNGMTAREALQNGD